MKRIDSVNARQNANGVGKTGFHDNADLSGQDATYLTPNWLNTIQEELCNLLEKNNIDLDSDNKEQLYELIAVKGDVNDGLDEHIAAANPHPQYVLKSEGAEKLKTARKINGVLFDGTQDIDILVGALNNFIRPPLGLNLTTGIYSDAEFSLQVNKMYISPVSFQRNVSISKMGFNLTAETTENLFFGIYESDASNQPINTPVNSLKLDMIHSVGENFKECQFTFKAGEIYWLFVLLQPLGTYSDPLAFKANDDATTLPFSTAQPSYQMIMNYSGSMILPPEFGFDAATCSQDKPPVFLFEVI